MRRKKRNDTPEWGVRIRRRKIDSEGGGLYYTLARYGLNSTTNSTWKNLVKGVPATETLQYRGAFYGVPCYFEHQEQLGHRPGRTQRCPEGLWPNDRAYGKGTRRQGVGGSLR